MGIVIDDRKANCCAAQTLWDLPVSPDPDPPLSSQDQQKLVPWLGDRSTFVWDKAWSDCSGHAPKNVIRHFVLRKLDRLLSGYLIKIWPSWKCLGCCSCITTVLSLTKLEKTSLACSWVSHSLKKAWTLSHTIAYPKMTKTSYKNVNFRPIYPLPREDTGYGGKEQYRDPHECLKNSTACGDNEQDKVLDSLKWYWGSSAFESGSSFLRKKKFFFKYQSPVWLSFIHLKPDLSHQIFFIWKSNLWFLIGLSRLNFWKLFKLTSYVNFHFFLFLLAKPTMWKEIPGHHPVLCSRGELSEASIILVVCLKIGPLLRSLGRSTAWALTDISPCKSSQGLVLHIIIEYYRCFIASEILKYRNFLKSYSECFAPSSTAGNTHW